MILGIKICKHDLEYKEDIKNCLIHNSLNTSIEKIVIFYDFEIDGIEIDRKSRKILWLKMKMDHYQAIEYLMKSSRDLILYSTPFIKFNNDINLLKDQVRGGRVAKCEDSYYVFEKGRKLYNSSEIDRILSGEFVKPNLQVVKSGYYSIPNFPVPSLGWKISRSFDAEADYLPEAEENKIEYVADVPKRKELDSKIDVIIVSVDYNDFLEITLEKNKMLFKNITVVTSLSDDRCVEICERNGAKVIKTDCMYSEGASFNKGKAINKGISSIENPDIILILDADIIVNDIPELEFEEGTIYYRDRIMIPDYASLTSGSLDFPIESLGPVGYFQLFKFSARNNRYPENYTDAAWSDVKFASKFKSKKKIDSPVIHLGKDRVNWNGRVSENFTNDEVVSFRPKEDISILSTEEIVDYRMHLASFSVPSKKDYLSVVITNWRRPERLKMCLESVVSQNVRNIVISCFDFSEEVRDVIEEFMSERPDIKLDIYGNDNGCNQLWLRGVYQARTKYVMLLHDDDFLSDNFEKQYNKVLKRYMKKEYGFFIWNGQVEKDGKITDRFRYLDLKTGVYDTDSIIYHNYKIKGNWPISPVVQIFERDLLLRTLKECESNFKSIDFYTKPKMMLGNEILSTLRHFEKFDKFVYIDDYLSKFGSWEGSESILNEKSKSNRLMVGYDASKEYFSKNPIGKYTPEPYIIHVSSVYRPKDKDSSRRASFAQKTWQESYEKHNIIPAHLYDSFLDGKMPKIKDLIDHAFQISSENDIIMYTNSDICLSGDIYNSVLESCNKWKCTFSFRKDFRERISRNMSKEEIEGAEWYVGADLFAFTREWWESWRDFIPDGQVIGRPTWDWVFRIAMGYSIEGKKVFLRKLEDQGSICETKDISYHEKHDSYWERAENIFIDENIENSKIAYRWMLDKSGGRFTGKDFFEKQYGNHIL